MNVHNKNFNTPLYNSKILEGYVRYIQENYPYVNINDILDYAGINRYELNDSEHWFTQNQIDKFYTKAVQLTKNNNIARDAGRYAVSTQSTGYIVQWVLGFIDPLHMLNKIDKIAPKYTRSSKYETKRLSHNKVEVKVTPYENTKEKPFQCENRKGYFEEYIKLLNCDNVYIEHSECLFNGYPHCKYIISWSYQLYNYWKTIRNTFIPIFILIFPFIIFNFSLVKLYSYTVLLLIFIIAECVLLCKENKYLRTNVKYLNNYLDDLITHNTINYNNALLISEIGETITRQTSKNDLIQSVVYNLKDRLNFDRSMILMPNKNRSKLEYVNGYGYSNYELEIMQHASFNINKSESNGPLIQCYNKQIPILIDDIDNIQNSISQHSKEFAEYLNIKSFLCCPISYDSTCFGVIAVNNIETNKPLAERDLNLISGIANFIAISFHKIDLLDAKENQFQSLLKVLATSTEARDKLTAGHSENVTKYAIGIAEELGLNNESKYLIEISSYLHDYGKIGVPDAILKKNGKLTEQEYNIVKSHPVITYNILSQINFEGLLEKVPYIAACHHEKLDGSGYPYGLTSHEIPFESKIIAVADVFEALTSTRHYRNPMPVEQAFHILNQGRNINFDPTIIDAFCRYYTKTFN